METPAKNPVGGASKNKKIRERVDSEGKYGRWKLRVMGSSEWGKRNEMGNWKWEVENEKLTALSFLMFIMRNRNFSAAIIDIHAYFGKRPAAKFKKGNKLMITIEVIHDT